MDQDKWRKFFRSGVNIHTTWVKVMLDNGEHHFFSDFNKWLDLKELCEKKSLFISEMELQFRSHRVKIEIGDDAEAIYFIRSIMGSMGAPSKNYYTVGILRDGVVHKKMFLTPELMVDKEMENPISECFTEAMIYNEKAKKNGEE